MWNVVCVCVFVCLLCDQRTLYTMHTNSGLSVLRRVFRVWFRCVCVCVCVCEDCAKLVETHADAKRYLCNVDAEYFAKLSEASITTLGFQVGGWVGG